MIGLEMYMIGTAVCFIGLTVHTKGPRAKNKLASRTMGPAVHVMVLGRGGVYDRLGTSDGTAWWEIL